MAAGRPKKITDDVIRKLEEAFLLGCTDNEACCYADIGASTLYDYCKANPKFSERKEILKNNLTLKAKKVINVALDGGDVLTANKVIDRKEGAKIKQELSGPGGGAIENKYIVEFVDAKATDTE